jgi:hypothetical protein
MPTILARRELTPMPARIAALPLDRRGYPVPWFVPVLNGEPEFRAMNPAKWARAVRTGCCWVCGGPTGAYLAFVIGPMCGINRTSAEPPNHRDCARWSAINCPFLARPHMVRREDEPIASARDLSAGIPILRNPGVAGIWITKSFRVISDDRGRPLITMGDPVAVEWYAEGRPATRAEVEASIDSGYPALLAVAEQQRAEGAVTALEQYRRRLTPWLPPEAP